MAQTPSEPDLRAILGSHPNSVIYFGSEWHLPSKKGGQIDQIIEQLKDSFQPKLFFLRVDVDEFGDFCSSQNVTSVPEFIFMKNGTERRRFSGVNAAKLSQMTQEFVAECNNDNQSVSKELSMEMVERLTRLTRAAPIMLFMKGTPQDVTCKYSRQIVEILDSNSITYGSFNILSDEPVREGLRIFSKWNTYPQLYARGKLIGGLDVVKGIVERNPNLSEYLNGLSPCCDDVSLDGGCCQSNQATQMNGNNTQEFRPCSNQCACARERQKMNG